MNGKRVKRKRRKNLSCVLGKIMLVSLHLRCVYMEERKHTTSLTEIGKCEARGLHSKEPGSEVLKVMYSSEGSSQ